MSGFASWPPEPTAASKASEFSTEPSKPAVRLSALPVIGEEFQKTTFRVDPYVTKGSRVQDVLMLNFDLLVKFFMMWNPLRQPWNRERE